MATKKSTFTEIDVFKTFENQEISYPYRFVDTAGNEVNVPFRLWEICCSIFGTMHQFCLQKTESMEAFHQLAYDANFWKEWWFDIFVDENDFSDMDEDDIEYGNFCELDIVESGVTSFTEIDRKEEMLPTLCYIAISHIELLVKTMLDGVSCRRALIEMSIEADRYGKLVDDLRREIAAERFKAKQKPEVVQSTAVQSEF